MTRPLALIAMLLSPVALRAAEADRFVTSIALPGGRTAVVAEGDLEARSIGSFSVRLYQAAAPGDETTFFVTGLIRARDGTVEKVVLADIDGDKKSEIVVVIRSAGTGGYLSAHAFAYDETSLAFRALAGDLAATADPVAALRQSASKGQ